MPPVRHHAGLHFADFRRVAAGRAASFRSNAQIARIDETHVLGTFAQPLRVERAADLPERSPTPDRAAADARAFSPARIRQNRTSCRPDAHVAYRLHGNPCRPGAPCASGAWSAHRSECGRRCSRHSSGRLPLAIWPIARLLMLRTRDCASTHARRIPTRRQAQLRRTRASESAAPAIRSPMPCQHR